MSDLSATSAARSPMERLRAPKRLQISLLIGAALLVLPFVAPSSWLFIAGICFANSLGVLSVSFLVRYGGEVSIGHAVFMAAGAYTVAIAETQWGIGLWLSLPLAVAIGTLLGLAFAWPSRRMSGIYLAVTTMALALALPEMIDAGDAWTGGYEGLYVTQKLLSFGSMGHQRYYMALLVLFAGAWAIARLRVSRQGMAILLARTHPAASDAFGTSRTWARMSVMGISAGLAGGAGAAMAYGSATVSPTGFTLWTSIFLLVGSVVSLYGLTLGRALIGGAFLTLIPQFLSSAGAWIPVLYGSTLLLVILAGHHAPRLREAWTMRRTKGGRS